VCTAADRKGVDVTALDEEGRSVLQLACQYSDTDTAQLLLDNGAWYDELGVACILAAVDADNAAILDLLNEHCDIDDLLMSKHGESLLHAAAAWGRPRCAALQLFKEDGYDGHDLNAEGHTALDLACAAALPESLRSCNITRAEWPVRKQVALLLLERGADADTSKLAGNARYAEAVTQHMTDFRDKLCARDDALAAHAQSNYIPSTICVNTAVAAAAATAAVVSSSAVKKFQLVNADTGAKGKRIYTYDSALLAKLHTAVNSNFYDAGPVKFKFAPPSQNDVTALPYRGT
jgi:hypothetical protein